MDVKLSNEAIKKQARSTFGRSLLFAGVSLILLFAIEDPVTSYTFAGCFFVASMMMAYAAHKESNHNKEYAKTHRLLFEDQHLVIVEEESTTTIPYKYFVEASCKERNGSIRQFQLKTSGGITLELHRYDKVKEVRLLLKRLIPHLRWS